MATAATAAEKLPPIHSAWMTCGKSLSGCVLMKRQLQLCCLVEQCAFPCDEEVPCAIAVCGLACYPKCGFCSTLEELTGVKQTVYTNNIAPASLVIGR